MGSLQPLPPLARPITRKEGDTKLTEAAEQEEQRLRAEA